MSGRTSEEIRRSIEANRMELAVSLKRPGGRVESFGAICRIDTLDEVEYFRHGGILSYVLRRLRAEAA